MVHKITADIVLTGRGKALTDAVIICNHDGEILDIIKGADDFTGVQRYPGILCPGFVNAHCHLELSHLKGVIPSGTGLVPFIKGVISLRAFEEDYIRDCIEQAHTEMVRNGIVAVGDISNTSDTAAVKTDASIAYYTFVEVFDFMQDDGAENTLERYRAVYLAHSDKGSNQKSYVPHAPYSVSPALYRLIHEANPPGAVISIHNQETLAEEIFIRERTGPMADFYRQLNMPLPEVIPFQGNSLDFTRNHLLSDGNLLLVHNTLTTLEDILKTMAWHPHTYWVSCPNANLYIENRLPDYSAFLKAGATICLGTDSLSSNWQLSILEEMKTIKKYQSHIPDMDILEWATINGARALGFSDRLGSIEVGKAPGIVWLKGPVTEAAFTLNSITACQRII